MPSAPAVPPLPNPSSVLDSRLEWDFLHVRALQCAARLLPAPDAALLAAPDAPPWQVSRRLSPEVWRRSPRSRRSRPETCDLGACRFRWRGGGFKRPRYRTATEVPLSSSPAFNHHQHRAETRCPTLRRRQRVLFSPRLRLRHPALPRFSPAGSCGCRRNGILAGFSSPCQIKRRSHRRHQLPHFRPLLSRLQALSLLASEIAGEDASQRRSLPRPDRRRPPAPHRNWRD